MLNYKDKIEKIKKDLDENLKKEFLNYRITAKNDKIFISGVLLLFIQDETVGRYFIEIEMPDMKNTFYPVIREKGGKIPLIGERHVNKNGTSCLFYPDDFKKYYKPNSELSKFVKGPVFTYFVAQVYFELTGRWLFGQMRHNADGCYDYYSQKLKVSDHNVIIFFLCFLLKKCVIQKNEYCPCGSLKKFRKCHYHKLIKIEHCVPKAMLENSLTRMLSYVDELKTRQERLKFKRELNLIISKSLAENNTLWYNINSISRLISNLNYKPKSNGK